MIQLQEGGNPKDLEKAVQAAMDKHTEHFEKEISKLRTGRANPAIIENVKVECYGTTMPLKDVASITAPDAQLLVVQPWDQSIISNIEKGLTTANLNATPSSDGALIRIQLPKMSADRRDDMIKLLHKKAEECKVGVRNARKEFNNLIRSAEKDKSISEDTSRRLQTMLQNITDSYIKRVGDIAVKKESEVKTI